MNTSELHLHCKRPEAFMILQTFQKLNLLLMFTFYYKYLIYCNFFYNLGDKTIYYLIFNRIYGFVGVLNRKTKQSV